MMFLHTLRLAGDLSFYYAFAGFFAASFGGTPMPLVLVWPALCFGLASCFEGSRPLRTTLAALCDGGSGASGGVQPHHPA